MGFIDGLDDIISLEREVLTEIFAAIHERFASSLAQFDSYLPSLDAAPGVDLRGMHRSIAQNAPTRRSYR